MFDSTFIKIVLGDNLDEFIKIIHNYNHSYFYSLSDNDRELLEDKYDLGSNKYRVIGIVAEIGGCNILTYLLNDNLIDFNNYSVSNSYAGDDDFHEFTLLYQVLSAENNSIYDNCFNLCTKILDKEIYMDNIVHSFRVMGFHGERSGIEICEINHPELLDTLISYEQSIKYL